MLTGLTCMTIIHEAVTRVLFLMEVECVKNSAWQTGGKKMETGTCQKDFSQGPSHSKVAKVECIIKKKKSKASKHPMNNRSQRCYLCSLRCLQLALQVWERASLCQPSRELWDQGCPFEEPQAGRKGPGPVPPPCSVFGHQPPTLRAPSTSFPKGGTELCLPRIRDLWERDF